MRNPLEIMFSALTPESCVVCHRLGSVLCSSCAEQLEYPDRCFRCKNPSIGGLTCQKCIKKTAVTMQVLVTSYDGIGKKLVQMAKYQPSRVASDHMGVLLASKLPFLGANTIITPLPTTSDRVRSRGFDQSKRIARSMSRASKLTYQVLLSRSTSSHQVGASRSARLDHMKHGFEPCGAIPAQTTVILVDDVVTTGATMESAAKVIESMGADRIIACYFARAE